MLGCPQLALAVEMGEIEAPNPRTVEAKCKTKWPPRGQTAERERVPDWSPREVLHKCNPNVLKSTGNCKPEGELAALKSAAPWDLEGKMWYEHKNRVSMVGIDYNDAHAPSFPLPITLDLWYPLL